MAIIPSGAPASPSVGVDYYLEGMVWQWNGTTFYVTASQPTPASNGNNPNLSGTTVYPVGAAGDGVTDDTAAIQRAIDNSPVGATIVFPPGTYIVSSTIKLKPFRRYTGSFHYSAVKIKLAAGVTGLAAVLAAEGWVNNTGLDNPIFIERLTVDGNKANTAGANTSGIQMFNWQSVVRDVHIENCSQDGLRFTDASQNATVIPGTAVENRIEDCRFTTNARYGFYVWEQSGSGKLTDGFLINCIFNSNGSDAARLDRSAGWLVQGNHTYTGATFGNMGIWCKAAFGTRVIGNYIDNYGQASGSSQFWSGIRVDLAATRGSVIADNIISCTEDSLGGTNTYRHLYVICPTGLTGRAIVTGNIVYGGNTGNGAGIRIESGSGSTFNVQVTDNQVDNISAAASRYSLVSTGTLNGTFDLYGTGSPANVVAAPVGSTYHRIDGGGSTSIYVKESATDNTGWTAK